jgi:hypothetical protein
VTDGAPRYVSFDRWDAAHAALVERVFNLEQAADRLRGAETEHRALADRIGALEQEVSTWRDQQEQAHTERRTRSWQVALAVVTGLVLPLASLGVIAVLHLITRG